MYLCTRNYDLKRGGTFETAKAGTFHSVTAGTSIPLFTHLKCNGKVTTSWNPFCCQKLPPVAKNKKI